MSSIHFKAMDFSEETKGSPLKQSSCNSDAEKDSSCNIMESSFLNSPDEMIIIDSDSVIQNANPSFCINFGYKLAEITGQQVNNVLHLESSDDKTSWDDKDLQDADYPVMGEQTVKSVKTGFEIPVAIYNIPLKDNRGKENILVVFRDLTTSRKKEELKGIAKAILESSSTVVFKLKAEKGWPVEYISENISLFGYTVRELTSPGFLFASIMHSEDVEMVEKETEKYLFSKERSSNIHEYRLIRKDGSITWVREENRPVYDENNNIVYFLGVLTDDNDRITTRMELQKTNEMLKRTFKQTIEVLAETAGRRDPYTASHQKRVAELAFEIGKKLDLDDNRLEGLYLAAIVHDLGKISIPAEILTKPSGLTEIEFSIIKTHPESSYDILSKVHTSWPIAEIAWQHHERLDGSGYPRGLKGKDILKEAKIIAVADIVEAVSAHRPYRAGRGIETALEIIREERDTKLDREAVDACLELFEEGFSFEEE